MGYTCYSLQIFNLVPYTTLHRTQLSGVHTMTTIELMAAFRLAEETGHITDLSAYPECLDSDCSSCPASKACNFMLTFNYSFGKLLPSSVLNDPRYTLENLQANYPEYFL